jgi:hypothetical protein
MASNMNGVSVAHPGATGGAAGVERCALRDAWLLRNATAEALLRAEDHMRRLIQAADVAELVALVEAFAPSRSTGPEWTRTFEPLVERLWAWCDDERMAALEAEFTARGMPWMAVANDFAPERGAELRGRLRQPAWARFPAFTTG